MVEAAIPHVASPDTWCGGCMTKIRWQVTNEVAASDEVAREEGRTTGALWKTEPT